MNLKDPYEYDADAEMKRLCEKYGLTEWDDDDDDFLDLSKPITSSSTKTKVDEEYEATYGIMTHDEVEQALADLETKVLGIDDLVKQGFTGEEAADEAKGLVYKYRNIKYKLERRQREFDQDARAHLVEIGADDYGLDDDGNILVTQMMDGVVAWYEAERAKLTEALELHMQETVNALRDTHGINVDHNVRDTMYETLVHEEVIEQWEPLEF